jgi:F-type H+-transporting ATPase subunit alpha
MLNQDELSPWAPEDQVAAVYSGTGGYLDRIKVNRVKEFHELMIARLHAEEEELMGRIADGEWGDEIEERLGTAIGEAVDDFGPDFDEEGNPIEEGESDRIRERRAGRPDGAGDGRGEEGGRALEGAGAGVGTGGATTGSAAGTGESAR